MKKSSSAVVVTVLIIALAGALYMGRAYILKRGSGDLGNFQKADEEEIAVDNSEDIYFGEYVHNIHDDEKITVKYLKSAGVTRIYSIYPVETKDKYDISSSGNMAVYGDRGGHIWLFYNDGTFKKLTPDKYESIDKKSIGKEISGYIWTDKLELVEDGVMFISNLPDTSSLPQKSIWQIGIDDGKMRMIYTPVSSDYRILGQREDGKLMILDGEVLVAVDRNTGLRENINIAGKYIISLSPDGTKVIYARSYNNVPQFNILYMMDGWGNNSTSLPNISGYTSTDMGAWSDDSSKYSIIIRGGSGADKIGLIFFEEDHVDIAHYSPEANVNFPKGSILKWTSGSTMLIDTGEDVITVDFE